MQTISKYCTAQKDQEHTAKEKIMRRALLTVALTFCIAAAAAPVQPRIPPATSHLVKPIKLQRMPAPENSKLVVKTSEKIVRSSSKNLSDRLPLRNESGWPTSSMLLATLLFMGAIALRRHVSGKP